jgi:serine/threonine-protein kinase
MAAPRVVFTFHRCLGEGGYGEVYLAHQVTEGGLQREVAVKVLHERYDDDSNAVKRLRDEGQVLALLAHPSILTVHGFTKIAGRLALVTEYVEGADVSVFCHPEHLLPPRVAVEVARDVAEALHYALTVPNPHTGRPLKMIHRDVKPANVRVSVDGKVKLLDFGVARSNEMDRQAKTAMGDVLLTSGFASPEALGFGVSGPSVDVFALGVTLFAMLTGKQFYRGRDLRFQVTLAMNAVDFTSYLEERVLLVDDPDLQAILLEILAFQHELRPKAEEVGERLDALLQRMEGPTLGQWARGRTWAIQEVPGAELTGARIDVEGRILGESEVPAPPRTLEQLPVAASFQAPPAPSPATPAQGRSWVPLAVAALAVALVVVLLGVGIVAVALGVILFVG